MATPKKGKSNAKAKASAKKAPGKKTQAKKVAAKPAVKPAEKSVLVRPVKGDIIMAMAKYWVVMSSSKRTGTVVAATVHMVECGMKGVNFHREITWDMITKIYKDAGYHG